MQIYVLQKLMKYWQMASWMLHNVKMGVHSIRYRRGTPTAEVASSQDEWRLFHAGGYVSKTSIWDLLRTNHVESGNVKRTFAVRPLLKLGLRHFANFGDTSRVAFNSDPHHIGCCNAAPCGAPLTRDGGHVVFCGPARKVVTVQGPCFRKWRCDEVCDYILFTYIYICIQIFLSRYMI